MYTASISVRTHTYALYEYLPAYIHPHIRLTLWCIEQAYVWPIWSQLLCLWELLYCILATTVYICTCTCNMLHIRIHIHTCLCTLNYTIPYTICYVYVSYTIYHLYMYPINIIYYYTGEEGSERHLRPPQHKQEDRLEAAHVQKRCVSCSIVLLICRLYFSYIIVYVYEILWCLLLYTCTYIYFILCILYKSTYRHGFGERHHTRACRGSCQRHSRSRW